MKKYTLIIIALVIGTLTLSLNTFSQIPCCSPDQEQLSSTNAGVTDVQLDLLFDPPWDQSMMSEAAKLELGML